MNRSQDWIGQAEKDLEQARNARENDSHEWACFGAQQAAEKAVKGVILHLNMEGWGHSVTDLLNGLKNETKVEVPDDLIDGAKQLDKHYIPTRYPNGFERGKPADYYTDSEAKEAIQHAREILAFCHRQTRTEEGGAPGASGLDV